MSVNPQASINRQVFLSLNDSNELTIAVGINGEAYNANEGILVSPFDTIEWLLAPDSSIMGISEIIGIDNVQYNNGWFWQGYQAPLSPPLPFPTPPIPPYTYPVEIYLIGIDKPFNLNIHVIPRVHQAQIWQVYFKSTFTATEPTEVTIFASHFPDGSFKIADDFITNVFPGDIINWQFASSPYSSGGEIMSIQPKEYEALFSSILLSWNVCAGIIKLDANTSPDFVTQYYVKGAAVNPDTGQEVPFDFDPKIRVNAF